MPRFGLSLDAPWDLAIWVDTPPPVCLERGLARDGGVVLGERARLVWETVWQPREDRYIEDVAPMASTDFVVDGTRPSRISSGLQRSHDGAEVPDLARRPARQTGILFRMAEVLPQPSVLRPMTPGDLDLLLPIQREAAQVAFATVFPQDEFPFPTEAIRHRWELELADPDIECFVIVDADRSVAGFAALEGHQFLHFGTALGSWGGQGRWPAAVEDHRAVSERRPHRQER